jgi:hypothetical protein
LNGWWCHDPNLFARPTLPLVGDDSPDERRQGRKLGKPEADTVLGELFEAPTLVETAASDRTHLVVQIRPTHAPAPIAEANEVRCLRGGLGLSCSAGIHEWRASFPR